MQHLLMAAMLLAGQSSALFSTTLVTQLAPGTWLENLAVRASGTVLATMTAPDAALYEIDPKASSKTAPKLIAKFPISLGAGGIAETKLDTFYVSTSNASLETLQPVPMSEILWRVSFPGPKVEKIVILNDALLINGIVALNNHTILAADSILGVVFAINTSTGAYKKVIEDPLMVKTDDGPLGVNGLKLHGSELYFTNTAQELIGKICINADGTPAGKAVKVASSSKVPIAGIEQYDDLILDREGRYTYAAVGGGNVIQRTDLQSGKSEVIAGNLNSTAIAEPTAAQFGRRYNDRNTLYVTTGGALGIPVYSKGKAYRGIGAQLVAINLGRK